MSQSTLLRVWHDRWERYLKFRNVGQAQHNTTQHNTTQHNTTQHNTTQQGKRCRVCARIDAERLLAVTAEERAEVVKAKGEHIRMVMADRGCSVRGNRIAERDAANPSVDGIGQILKINVDGMDQAKFKCPRNMASTAEFDACWRPQLHVVGAICHGHLEAYFIMNTDQAKDASMNCTVISRVLDLVRDDMDDRHALPRNLVISADNTARESKNQIFANYNGYLVASEKFDTDQVEYKQPGHTHDELDQRFSTVASMLSRAPVLEDPPEFRNWIEQNVVPPRGRKLHVEVLFFLSFFFLFVSPLLLLWRSLTLLTTSKNGFPCSTARLPG